MVPMYYQLTSSGNLIAHFPLALYPIIADPVCLQDHNCILIFLCILGIVCFMVPGHAPPRNPVVFSQA